MVSSYMGLTPYMINPTQLPPYHGSMVVKIIDVAEFFFIAHPESGRKEGEEHKRIMYYYPTDELLDKKTDITGFAEAVVNFTDNFTSPHEQPLNAEFPYRTVETAKTYHVYIQVENCEFLVGFALNRHLCSLAGYTLFLPALINVLGETYKMFRMFFGCMSRLRADNDEKFKENLSTFFFRFLPQMRLQKMPMLDYLEGVSFLPLESTLYLNVVTLSNELQEEFSSITKVVFFYQDKILYYTVEQRDLPSLCRYITLNLLPLSIDSELEPGRPLNGRYLRGPTELNNDAPLLGDDSLPSVFLHTVSEETELARMDRQYMLIYRSLNATVCMFVRDEVTRQMMRNIDGFLGSELSKLASLIGDSIGQEANDLRLTADFHYIYFNPASLSMTSSFDDRPSLGKVPLPPAEVYSLACETLKSFLADEDAFGESFVKSITEWWIVLKKVNSRLLCLLLPPSQHQQTLVDVQARTQVLIKSHFENIFLN